MAAPAVAIIADNPLQRHRLQHAVGRYGLSIAFVGDPVRYLDFPVQGEIALWIVDVQDDATCERLLDNILDNSDAALLLGPDLAPDPNKPDYPRWERRLFGKLQDMLGEVTEPAELNGERPASATMLSLPMTWPANASARVPGEGDVAREIWILAASLGGPAAVKEFLDRLPPGLPVGFVYAQHIDANFTRVLARVLGRHAHDTLLEASDGDQLRVGEVMLMPVDREVYLDPLGHVRFHDHPWPGPYGPSIDQVMLNMADHYRAHCHVILFSGMGCDGAVAAPVLHAYGSRIWVQSSESCANSSMPDSVAATGCSSFTGTPAQLAAQLVRTLDFKGPTDPVQRDSARG